ncbi:NXPE family member 3 isoform X3 [Osmerus eperlanus]|uniref:NXPE family member 3 isoform X3 n=1 Tax=Osmerus eperlanus TaxID=29151 RepID=UPI002E123526
MCDTIVMVTAENEMGLDPGKARGSNMCRSLSKYAPVFLVLALSGLIFLIRNIHTLERLNCQTVSTFYNLQNSLHSAFTPEGPSSLYRNQTYCAHLGQEPSPDELLEEHYLLDSISWPEPPARPISLSRTSDPAHSLFAILPAEGGKEWRVGDQLEALVQIHDFQGRPKHHGGDFLLARLHSPELGAGVAGQVLDHRNGFYSALFPLLWEGTSRVEVTLVHPSEAVAVLRRLREERPDRVFFKSLFRSGFLSETTVCNLCLPAGQQPLCNYTDQRTGEPWYCYKPKLLGCNTRINHFKGGYQKHLLTNKEALLFQSGVNIKVAIHASGSNSITVLPEEKELKEFNLHSPKNVGPYLAVDSTHNIMLQYRCHGPPIRFSTVASSEMRYVANELDGLSGGPDTVVVLSVWAHFSTFPVEVYIRRLRHIRRAVLRLLDRAPGTKVVVRSANLQALDPEVSLYNSDWFSLQLDGVLRAMFKGLDVLLVDAWEMTAAHHLPHALHPSPTIVKNMIDTMLTHICSQKKKS